MIQDISKPIKNKIFQTHLKIQRTVFNFENCYTQFTFSEHFYLITHFCYCIFVSLYLNSINTV